MPSFLHEALVELLRSRPDMLAYLLRNPSLPTLPPHDQIVSDSADLGTALAPELAADGLIRVEHAGQTVLVIVFEVQLAIDPRKLFSWPSYLVAARARHRCDAILIVVTPDAAVAAWAQRPIPLGPRAGSIQAAVIGPREMPNLLTEGDALQIPELAVLSAIAHGQDSDPQHAAAIACTAIAAALSLNDHRAEVYYDLIKRSLSDAAKEALAMIPQYYEFQDEGLRKAWTNGLNEGEARGEARGESRGEARGLGEALIDTIEARGLAVNATQLTSIRDCQDPSVLRRWHRQAITATSMADVFR
jgi:hypothetical protein